MLGGELGGGNNYYEIFFDFILKPRICVKLLKILMASKKYT